MVLHFISVFRRKYATFKRIDAELRVVLIKRYIREALWFAFFPFIAALAFCLRIVLRMLKPLVHIRFARLWSFSLGSFAIPTEVYLCQRDAGMHPKRSLDIFYHYDREGHMLQPSARREALICNQQLDKMFRSKLRLWDGARFLDQLNRLLISGSEDFIAQVAEPYDQHGLFDRFPAHLVFTKEEERRGQEGLRELGVEPSAPFVCFHARDPVYAARARPRLVSVYGNWVGEEEQRIVSRYGPWRIGDERNTTISNYLSAADELTRLGYYAIRMGKYVEGPIHTDNLRIVDYGYKYHSDFMDVYLSARCTFFIGQNSGMAGLPMIFRRPMVFVNVYPLVEIQFCSHTPALVIPKKFYSRGKGRLLSLREIADLGLNRFYLKHLILPEIRDLYEKLDLEIQEDTPEEIAKLAMEMHQRLHSAFKPSEEDEALQRRFLAFLRSNPDAIPLKPGRSVAMGTHFLSSHPELLD